ncbi:MAG: hypothetical protein AB8H03_22165 [Saprospiraceae bacterium]
MEQLKELVYILSLNKTKKIRQYGFLQDETGRLLEFYQGLVDEAWETDEAAAKAILNLDPKHKTYRRLKNNLKEELLNAFFFLDFKNSSHSDIQEAHHNCYKTWAQISRLSSLAAKKTSTYLSKQILKKAIEYDLTFIIIESSRQLRRINAVYVGSEKEHAYYSNIIEKYSKILLLEIQAESIYTSLIRHYAKSKATQNHLFDIYKKDYEDIIQHLGKVDSFIFNSFGYMIGVTLYMSVNDFKSTNEICQAGITYFENKPYNHKAAQLAFLYQSVICSMQLGNYEEGKTAIEKCYSLAKVGKHDWFRTLENHLLLCLYTSEHNKAWELFHTAEKSRGFKHLLPAIKDRWILHEAYIYFLVEIGVTGDEVKSDKKFKVRKFLNSVSPAYSQDKRGLNIPILIIQVFFLWNRAKFDDAYQRIEALSKYNSRHLKKEDDTYRTALFIKMLEVSAKYGFQPEDTKKHTADYFKLLNEAEIVFANQSAEIEYIPYHILWKYGIEILDQVHSN